jgi:hypothetical protein
VGYIEQHNISAESTNMDVWFEEWRVLNGVLAKDMSCIRRLASEVYVAAYLCIVLKMCFGLAENEGKTHPTWTILVDKMLTKWNKKHRLLMNNSNYTSPLDPPKSLAGITVAEFVNLISGNDSASCRTDEEQHPYGYDLKSKKNNRIQTLYRQMKDVLLSDSTEDVQLDRNLEDEIPVATDHTTIPPLEEEAIKDKSATYVKYKEYAGKMHWIRGKRLEGRVNDGTLREHLQFSFLLECMCDFLDIDYSDMLWCVTQCERALYLTK